MLVLSRMRDEVIMLGEGTTALVPLSTDEILILKALLFAPGDDATKAVRMQLFERLGSADLRPPEVRVVAIRGEKVRLGVTAPKGISIHRKEIYQRIQEERSVTAAAGVGTVGMLAQEGSHVPRE